MKIAVRIIPDGDEIQYVRSEYIAPTEHPEPLKLNSVVAQNEHLRRPG